MFAEMEYIVFLCGYVAVKRLQNPFGLSNRYSLIPNRYVAERLCLRKWNTLFSNYVTVAVFYVTETFWTSYSLIPNP